MDPARGEVEAEVERGLVAGEIGGTAPRRGRPAPQVAEQRDAAEFGGRPVGRLRASEATATSTVRRRGVNGTNMRSVDQVRSLRGAGTGRRRHPIAHHPGTMGAVTNNDEQPLLGRTVAVTAARRASEQRVLLERRGAEVLHAPAIQTIPVAEDALVRSATARVLAAPADLMVLTTATGVRWWMQGCEEWGLGEDLHALMARVPLYSRGPKVTGALRAAGLREHASAASEATPELLDMLLERGVAGLTVAVQLQGAGTDWNPLAPLVDGLRAAGADVIAVPIYRWEPPEDLAAFDALVATIARSEVDGVTFTSTPAVVSMLERAETMGIRDDLIDALTHRVAALCVGPVTAAPLVEIGVPVTMPDRMRLGALMRHVTEELIARAGT